MLYFKSNSGDVFAYETQADYDEFAPDGLNSMTGAEVDEHLNPAPKHLSREEVSELRRIAYADPITGSDPLYIEYQREIAVGASETIAQAARQAWLDRADEIAAEYPWPE